MIVCFWTTTNKTIEIRTLFLMKNKFILLLLLLLLQYAACNGQMCFIIQNKLCASVRQYSLFSIYPFTVYDYKW
jgi:hypothetical protein